ncbi:hypothetical protein AYI69_g8822 [Smittium culicis]|uniref:Uncharacterized protein n=1 Tax=Smittium culicis TaxID=133412 RepID=A0A1R1XGX4_9FUNG|nr:hypothetical protein AYI69_g8822 [Smittium culicis]
MILEIQLNHTLFLEPDNKPLVDRSPLLALIFMNHATRKLFFSSFASSYFSAPNGLICRNTAMEPRINGAPVQPPIKTVQQIQRISTSYFEIYMVHIDGI